MTPRVFNFSPGPAMLPLCVLEQARDEMLSLPGLGMSAMEISHRSPWFDGVLAETQANLRSLLGLGDDFSILFLQGGSRLAFSMIPMNFLRGSGKPADFLVTGAWANTALAEARREGEVHVAFDKRDEDYRRLPRPGEARYSADPAYVHYTSNETIQGVQFPREPETAAPLVCDASSDFLCRPLDVARYGLIFACAQKNAGPAGVTVVIVRQDFLERIPSGLHTMLDYREYAKQNSLANTPPVFAIYICLLITRWLKDQIGGLAKMEAINREKASRLYQVLDDHPEIYQGHAAADSRSLMNVTFRLPDEELTNRFLSGAAERQLMELKGHRSVGGIRASIYNAMPHEGVERLREWMLEFAK